LICVVSSTQGERKASKILAAKKERGSVGDINVCENIVIKYTLNKLGFLNWNALG
jgi:hypothetical protein